MKRILVLVTAIFTALNVFAQTNPPQDMVTIEQNLKKLDVLGSVLYVAAHPDDDFSFDRADIEDMQAFTYAITEYVYDLTDRYEEFKERQEERKRPRPSVAEMFASVRLIEKEI